MQSKRQLSGLCLLHSVAAIDQSMFVCYFQEIDEYVDKAKDQSYTALIALGSRGFAFATNLVLSTAAKVVLLLTLEIHILAVCHLSVNPQADLA